MQQRSESERGMPAAVTPDTLVDVILEGDPDVYTDVASAWSWDGVDSVGRVVAWRASASVMQVAGYHTLAEVLQRAYDQAAVGKGHERHANGEPFDQQVMQDMARRFGVGALLGQAFKKSEESQRLGRDAAVRELLGAINYLAGAVIALEREQ